MKKDDLSYLKELLEGQLDYLQNQADHGETSWHRYGRFIPPQI